MADLCFITRRYQECIDAALIGIENAIAALQTQKDPDIIKLMHNVRRDCINLKLRAAKKLEPHLDLEQLRA